MAWWRAEGNALDNVGANHGTLVHGATFAPGEVGQTFSLDGLEDRISVPEAAATDLSRQPSWTIEAWVRPASFNSQSWPTIYSEGRWAASLGINSDSGNLESWINDGNPLVGTVPLQLNAWNHVALTYDATGRTLYVNGAPAGSGDAPAIPPDDNGAAIGDVTHEPYSSYFEGLIDEVSVYNRALTSNEIAGIYAAGSAGKCVLGVPPAIVAQPQNSTNAVGTTATFSVTASGTLPLSYQWQHYGTNLLDGGRISGARTNQLTIANVQLSDAGPYSVIVANLVGATNSTNATLTVNAPNTTWSWNGSAGTDWFTPNNWTPAGIPGPNDTINFSSGTINFTAPVAINGQLNWSGGTFSGSTLTIGSSGVLNISGNNWKYLQNVLTNAGTVVWTDGPVEVNDNNGVLRGAIYNLAGGLFDIQTDQTLDGSSGGSYLFSNLGTVRKTASTGTTIISLPFYNSGTVSALQGTLRLSYGGVVEGTFSAANGTAILFSGGSFSSSAPTALTGSGSIQFTGDSLLLVNDAIANLGLVGGTVSLGANFQGGTITNLTLSGSTLSGTHTVSGTMNWTAGVLAGPLTIGSSGVLNISGNNWKYLQNVLTNAGTVVWTDGPVEVNNNNGVLRGAIYNLAGGLFDIQTDQTLDGSSGGSYLFSNLGTVRKTASTGTTIISLPLYNWGTVNALQGTLNFNNGLLLMGGSLNFGLSGPSSFGSMSVSGTANLGGGVSAVLLGGYVPAIGATFDVMSFGSTNGTFTDYSGLNVGSGRVLVPLLSSTKLTLQVQAAPCPTITLFPLTLPDGTVGVTYNQTVTAAGGAEPYVFTNTAGSLPAGLTLATNGIISGTPSAVGTNIFTVTATDTNKCSEGRTYTNVVLGIPPGISAQPQNTTNVVGTTASFTVIATGTAPLSYQWQFNGTNLTNNVCISGALTNSLTISNVLMSDMGDYRVIVNNAYGVTNSGVATLKVLKATPIVTWTNPAAITYGTALSGSQLNATASVPATPVYAPTIGTVLDARTNSLFVVFTPTDTTDYNSVTGAVGLVVLPAPLSVTCCTATRPYGQTNPVCTPIITGVTNGDNITATCICAATPSSPPGPYPITPVLSDPTNRLGNYTVTTNSGTLTVTMTAPTLLANGSFENGLAGWTVQGSQTITNSSTNPPPIPDGSGDTGYATTLSALAGSPSGSSTDVSPTDGSAFALIANTGEPRTATRLSQTFFVPSYPGNLSFNYRFMTEETNTPGFNDAFEVELNSNAVLRVSRDDLQPGGTNALSPLATLGVGGYAMGTAWRSAIVDLAPYAGQTVTLSFTDWDVGDAASDTAVALDGIAVNMFYPGQVLAHDDAAGYNAAGNTWTNGMNLGFGLLPWVLTSAGPAHQGSLIGGGGNIATTNDSAWGLYAFGVPTNWAVAFRGFSNSLPVGMAFKLQWRSGGIGNNPYNFAGFRSRTGDAGRVHLRLHQRRALLVLLPGRRCR